MFYEFLAIKLLYFFQNYHYCLLESLMFKVNLMQRNSFTKYLKIRHYNLYLVNFCPNNHQNKGKCPLK